MKYTVNEHDNGIDISVEDVKREKSGLLEAFQECQEGRCSCPTEEYKKLESLEIEDDGRNVLLHLKSKHGSKINKSDIEKCLDYTSQNVAKQTEQK